MKSTRKLLRAIRSFDTEVNIKPYQLVALRDINLLAITADGLTMTVFHIDKEELKHALQHMDEIIEEHGPAIHPDEFIPVASPNTNTMVCSLYNH